MDNLFSNVKLPDGTGPYMCPPKGQDSRDLTSYATTNDVAGTMTHLYGLSNASSLSQYIQANGKKIADDIHNYHVKNNYCFPNVCTDNFPTNITIKQMKEQREAADNKWNPNYKKNKGCSCLVHYRMTK